MPKLNKQTLAQTFRFDCDRFLRFQLATDSEKEFFDIESDTYKRPGIELMTSKGRQWEADKYQDLIDVSPRSFVEYFLKPNVDELIGRQPFDKITNLFEILRRPEPPSAIIEAEFDVPQDITPSLQQAYETHNLDPVKARPDIIWIRPARTGAPLIGSSEADPEYELHIIDVKMAAEPSLRHFTEVTFYAIALAAALSKQNLSDRYAVSAEGLIWPGNHDANAFQNLVKKYQSDGDIEPVLKALLDTLISVPYEVYQVHVMQFFEERLPRVLDQDLLEVSWHVRPRCQLCDYVKYCRHQAETCDHLSRLPWLSKGQADLLRQNGIGTTEALIEAIGGNTYEWQTALNSSHQLRADAPALMARAQALQSKQVVPIDGRNCSFMPAWSNQRIFITVHFDPGTGITFAMGAARVYFPANHQSGEPPLTEVKTFIVDRVDDMNPDTERGRLKEFIEMVAGWLLEVSDENRHLPKNRQLSSHIFFWDMLEVRQLRRMFARHMNHPDVVDLIELLIRLFPPDDFLPDPDLFKSQPGTVVKEVIRLLIGLPIPHDYTLLDTANNFFPVQTASGNPYQFPKPYGFITPMSDQIPFERAYELWQDRIFLQHFDTTKDRSQWRRYTRDEIYEGIKSAVLIRLQALQHVVTQLREHYQDRLTLKKAAFSAAPPTQIQVPAQARSLIAFQKLNAACQELENRQRRALPIDEREATFFSIRGLLPVTGPYYDSVISRIRVAEPRYSESNLLALTFSPTSRDARINEGNFLLAISNEDNEMELDVPWRKHLGMTFGDAQRILNDNGLDDRWMVNIPLRKLLQVEIVSMEAMRDPPFLVVHPGHEGLFQFAQDQGFLDVSRPMVLDPIFQDFSSGFVEKALRAVGGTPPPMKRKRRG